MYGVNRQARASRAGSFSGGFYEIHSNVVLPNENESVNPEDSEMIPNISCDFEDISWELADGTSLV